MARSTMERSRWPQRTLLFLAAPALALAALTLTPQTTSAQQHPVHPGGRTWRSTGVAAGGRPASTSPMRVTVPVSVPRAGIAARWTTSAPRLANSPLLARAGVSTPYNSSRPIGARPFARPFFFGRVFPDGFGYGGFASESRELPLGFGLWPACDSAATPGVFWTVGPCFGIGDYSAGQAASAGNEYGVAGAPSYLPPAFLLEGQEAGQSAQQNPGTGAPTPAMVLYLTNGSTIAATDWWVAHGRLQYITDSGTNGSIDLSQLDLEQTITQNEKRGLQFHLKFTPPSERP
jgi:hypothetical protein